MLVLLGGIQPNLRGIVDFFFKFIFSLLGDASVHLMLVSLRGVQPNLRGIVTRFDRII